MKKKTSDGLVPIYLRVTIDGEDDEISTGRKIDPELWNQTSQRMKGRYITSETINSYILQTEAFLDREFQRLSLEGPVSPAMLLSHFGKIDPEVRRICEEKRNEYYKQVNTFLERIYELKKQEKKLKHVKRPHQVWNRFDEALMAFKKEVEEYATDSYDFVDSDVSNKSLLDAVQEFLYNFLRRVLAEEVTFSTLKRWMVIKNKVHAFLPHRYKVSDILLKRLKPKHYQDLKEYLNFHDDIDNNAAHKYIKSVKQILTRAVNHEWIHRNPFEAFRCKYVDPDKLPLTLLEIGRIMKKIFSTSRLLEVRDVFIFCCFTGFAYNEVSHLTKDDIEFGIDRRYWINVDRGKTGKRVMVPLLPVAVDIIQKYLNHPYCVAYNKLLPVNSNQKFNEYLKEIGELCEITFEITTHTARRTFATTVALENGVPLKFVSIMLGHQSIRTTEIYIKYSKRALAIHISSLEEQLFDDDGDYIFQKGEGDDAYQQLTIPQPKYKSKRIQIRGVG